MQLEPVSTLDYLHLPAEHLPSESVWAFPQMILVAILSFTTSSIYIYIWWSGLFGKLLKSPCVCLKVHQTLKERIFYPKNDHKFHRFVSTHLNDWELSFIDHLLSHITSFKRFSSLVNWHISQARTFKYVFPLFCYMNLSKLYF